MEDFISALRAVESNLQTLKAKANRKEIDAAHLAHEAKLLNDQCHSIRELVLDEQTETQAALFETTRAISHSAQELQENEKNSSEALAEAMRREGKAEGNRKVCFTVFWKIARTHANCRVCCSFARWLSGYQSSISSPVLLLKCWRGKPCLCSCGLSKGTFLRLY